MTHLLNFIQYFLTHLIELVVIIYILRLVFRVEYKTFHSHWNMLIDNFSYSTKDFYEAVTKELETTKIDGIEVEAVFLKERGIFSNRRTYLRVIWREHQYDICSAPFGKGFFISWWLSGNTLLGEVLLSKIPLIGKFLVKRIYPETYYRTDSASMFMTYAQSAVQNVIKKITEGKGTRPLTESDKKPILNNIFKR